MPSFTCSAVLNDTDPLQLSEQLAVLESVGCEALEIELADGRYVPGFSGPAPWLAAAAQCTGLPVTLHALVDDPDRHLQVLTALPVRGVVVPLEACRHAHGIVQSIRNAGMEAGVSLNPTSSLATLEYVFPLLNRVVLWMVEPGTQYAVPAPGAFDRVRILREYINHHRRKVLIQVKGGLDIEAAALAVRQGADVITLDSRNVFGRGDLEPAIRHFREQTAAHAHLV
jgi:ribulose-phosphate 3-epimerase